jgi:hydrogenase maturation protease
MLKADRQKQIRSPAGENPGTAAGPANCAPSSTLVVGLGNPILGDDGLGWRVVQLVEEENSDPAIDFVYLAAGGLELMERMIGYSRVIIVDAFHSPDSAGQLYNGHLEEIAESRLFHTVSSHDTSLATAVELGRTMGAKLPDRIEIVALGAEIKFVFTDELSPPIANALPEAARTVIALLNESSN